MGLTEGTLEQLSPEVQQHIAELELEAVELRASHAHLEAELQTLGERLRLALFQRFGRSSERVAVGHGELFAEDEQESEDSPSTHDTVRIQSHQRAQRGRKAIDEHLPRVEIVHDIPEAEKHCGCGAALQRIGEETSERVQVIPEQIWVERHVRPKYACHVCEGSGDEEKAAVRVAPAPPSMIPGSITTAGLLAFILVNKFVDHLPFYRQEKRFERIGFQISRQDMSNWAAAVGKRVAPLVDLMRTRIRGGPVMQMDETPVQVLGEPGREDTQKSFMWLTRGGPPDTPACLYHFTPTRSAEYPRSLLGEYQGYLQADGYQAYAKLAQENLNLTLVGCWAHVRRKFVEAGKGSKKAGAAHEAVSKIRKLYQIEQTLREQDLSDSGFTEVRKQKVLPVLTELKRWLARKGEQVLPQSLMGKAVSYALSQWHTLERYLEHPWLTPDNNAAENAIRPFVPGRKNWLFGGSPRGADASCAIYSLIETAKQNRMNPYAYLYFLFTRIPAITEEAEWEGLLPWNLSTSEVNDAPSADVRLS